jgi:glycosyltransferase involved in cell wall biosynthesis
MGEKLVSIIIPVYNAEKYISRCLDSIINQSYKNIQIIVIDDGSTDNGVLILDKYKEDDNRISVYRTENRGVSYARNLGIEKAKGEYFVFVDADDFVQKDMIEKMYYRLLSDGSDICVCNVWRTNGDKSKIQSNRKDEQIVLFNSIEKEEYMITFLLRQVHAYCVWNKMYKRSLIDKNNIRFAANSEMYPEDMLFNLMYFTGVTRISWISEALYNHIKRKNSITTSYRNDIVNRYIECAILYKNYINQKESNELINVYYMMLNWNLINGVISSIRNNQDKVEKINADIKQIYLKESQLCKMKNLKYYSCGSSNVKLCEMILNGDSMGYIEYIYELMECEKVDEVFRMRRKWNAN